MHVNDRARLVPDLGDAPPPAGEQLGRVVAVNGFQVTAHFAVEALEATVGSLLGIEIDGSLLIGALREISLEKLTDGGDGARAAGRLDLLGQITCEASGEKRFHHGIVVYPRLGSPVVGVSSDELRVIFDLENPNTIEVGRLQQNASIGAYVNVDETVQKHFAIVGSTGAGKSTGLALILRKIIEARDNLRVLLIDAHNEYGDCFEDRSHVVGPANLRLPFWLLNFDEIVQIIFGSRTRAEHETALLAELIPAAKTEYARSRSVLRSTYRAATPEGGRFTVDTPVPYRFEDVIAAAESRMGKLENGDLAVKYQRLLTRIDTVRRNPRYAFIFDDGGDDSMVGILCQLLRLNDDGRPIAIVQLAGFPAETMEVIVSVLFRLAFEFGVWSDAPSPLLIVCEEAHNYANADRSVGFRPARDGLSRIAKEGRKHGVFLGLVTQRPRQLDPTLISQCSTVFAMRLGHEDDQKIVRAAVSESASRLLKFLPSLGTREALVIGAGVPTAMRLRFHELTPHCIPRSQAVWSGEPNSRLGLDEQSIAAIVARWRGVASSNRPAPAPAIADLTPRFGDEAWSASPYRK